MGKRDAAARMVEQGTDGEERVRSEGLGLAIAGGRDDGEVVRLS